MTDINKIISAINLYLEKNRLERVEANEVARYLDSQGLLNFSTKGQPFRKLLREGKIPNAEQPNGKNTSWYIRRSFTCNNSSIHTPKTQTLQVPSKPNTSNKEKSEGLLPIEKEDSEILILGTLPGIKSLELGEYYSNSSNKFWDILSQIYEKTIPISYKDKIEWLHKQNIALWDILKAAARDGSLDSNIQHPEANDILSFITSHPHLRMIVFNGSKPQEYFNNYMGNTSIPIGIKLLTLPSTSSANTHLTFNEKVKQWSKILE